MRPRICASILPEKESETKSLVELTETKPVELLEIRLDRLGMKSLPNVKTRLPLVATCRAKKDGGSFRGSEKERIAVLKRAAELGFDYVDMELEMQEAPTISEEIRELGCKLIVSHHVMKVTPPSEAISEIQARELKLNPDICKIVTYAQSHEDNLTLLNAIPKMSQRSNVVCFAMGDKGKISRILSPMFGAHFTIAALDKERTTAPGQMTVDELIEAWRILGLT